MPPRRPDLSPWIWGIAITTLLLMPLPTGEASRRWPELVHDLTDVGHPLAFAWLAHVFFRSLRLHMPPPSPAPYGWVIAGTAAYAAVTEYVQAFIGREPSIVDLGNDMLGVAFSLILHLRQELPAHRARAGLAPLAGLIAIGATLPCGFTLAAYAHRVIRAPVVWTSGSLLFAHFSHWQSAPYPALRVHEPLPDWHNHDRLQIDIENPQPQPYPVIIRIHDRWHDLQFHDRFNRQFVIPAHARQVLDIPLAQIRAAPAGRELDLGAVAGVIVYGDEPRPAGDFRIHQIRLVPQR